MEWSGGNMEKRKSLAGRSEPTEDNPPYSRLFIVCSKQITEDCLFSAFSEFGTIEDIRMPRDRNTQELRGVAYIKYSKTSEAAKAIEEMNHQLLDGSSRHIKVMVAASKSEVEDDDDEKYRRLFVAVERTASEHDVRNDFQPYGNIESVLLQIDKQSGERKGFGYVKFRKFLSAALAYEQVNRKYRPIFARPKRNYHQETSFETNINMLCKQTSHAGGLQHTPGQGYRRLQVMCSPYLNQEMVSRLFDIVPGMESCKYWTDLMSECGKAVVEYSTPEAAAYARQKLHQLEYPPGQRIFVRPGTRSDAASASGNVAGLVENLQRAMGAGSSPDLMKLVETIAQASTLIKKATGPYSSDLPEQSDLCYSNRRLPPPQPLADVNKPHAKRCFIVWSGLPPPTTVQRDVFCRFGDLIDVYNLPNKTVGYARYATARAAEEAIRVLHGAEICGVRVKVMEAEERSTRDDSEHSSKRAKTDN